MGLLAEIIVTFLIVSLIALMSFSILNAWVFSDKSNHRYTYVYERDQYELWEEIIANADKFEYKGFSDLAIHYVFDKYEAIIWKDTGLTSIHLNNDTVDCVLSTFDKKHSAKMSELLLNKIE